MKGNPSELKIYGLFDPRDNQLRYVGATVRDLKDRLRNHRNDKTKNFKVNWIKSLSNLELSPTIELLDTCNIDEWDFWEEWYIQYFKSIGCKLTNIATGGKAPMLGRVNKCKGTSRYIKNPNWINPNIGRKQPKESIERGRLKRIGRRHSEKHKQKISDSLIGNRYAKGFVHSQETRSKVSAAGKGRKMSKSFCEKLSKNKKGNKNRVGNKNSEKHKIVLWKAVNHLGFEKRYQIFEDIKNGNKTISQLAKEYGICKSSIHRMRRQGVEYYKEKEILLKKYNLI